MANGARSPPWTPPGSGELSREGSLAFSSGLPHPHSTAPRRAEAYFSILKEWRRTQALRQRPALPVTDVPVLRTLFGVKKRPRRKSWGKVLKPREAVVIETPTWDLTIFKVHFLRHEAPSTGWDE